MDILSQVFAGVSEVAMVDLPIHKNAGDSLISLGQMNYLGQLGISIQYMSDMHRFDAGQVERSTTGPIVLQGGGNVGDLWPEIQEFRERVIRRFPHRLIVQMPQSVHFASTSRMESAKRVFGSHPNFRLLLRESHALDAARRIFPDVQTILCPDMAFGLGGMSSSAAPEVDVMYLRRRDHESARNEEAVSWNGLSSMTVDWGLSPRSEIVWRLRRIPGQLGRRIPSATALRRFTEEQYVPMLRLLARDAVHRLGQGRVVVSDRLHAVILSALMGKPFVAIDNSYGKVSALFDDFLADFEGAFSTSLRDAPSVVSSIVAGNSLSIDENY